MREIKFRAFVDDDIIEGWPAVMHPVEQMRWGEDDELEAVHLLPCGWIDIKWINVLQYTGLKDKNGEEVYEGDILRNVDNPFVDKLPFEVKWNEYYGAWFWWSLLGEAGTDYLCQNIAKNCEVIGNIYQNPELLEGENG